MTEEAAEARSPGSPADPLDDLADADLVVEAVVEDLAVKQALFATRRGLQAGRDARHHHVVAAGHRLRPRRRARRT